MRCSRVEVGRAAAVSMADVVIVVRNVRLQPAGAMLAVSDGCVEADARLDTIAALLAIVERAAVANIIAEVGAAVFVVFAVDVAVKDGGRR